MCLLRLVWALNKHMCTSCLVIMSLTHSQLFLLSLGPPSTWFWLFVIILMVSYHPGILFSKVSSYFCCLFLRLLFVPSLPVRVSMWPEQNRMSFLIQSWDLDDTLSGVHMGIANLLYVCFQNVDILNFHCFSFIHLYNEFWSLVTPTSFPHPLPFPCGVPSMGQASAFVSFF